MKAMQADLLRGAWARRALHCAGGALLWALLLWPQAGAAQQTTFTITGPDTLTETDMDFMSGGYTITRSGAVLTESVNIFTEVNYITASAADFSAPGFFTFNAGDDRKTFMVTVKGDNLNEGAETFSIRTASDGGENHAAAKTTTINDDDAITIAIGDLANVQEGQTARFPLTLSGGDRSAAPARSYKLLLTGRLRF